MAYKIRRYNNFKRRKHFETYEPKRRIKIEKEHVVPFFVRFFHRFAFVGGMIGVFASSMILGIKGFFGIKEKVSRSRGKIVEVKIKK
jgi:hypothetical protein